MGADELATIEDCIRCAYGECLIDEDGERRLRAEVERLRAVRLIAYEVLCHLGKEAELGHTAPPVPLLARLERAIGPVDGREFHDHLRRAPAESDS